MLPASPVAAFYLILQQIAARAEAHAGLFQKNEAATRAALIDPVLRALGWDTADVRLVEPERSLGNELRVDYLLNDAAGKPHVVIEAKCLGSSLDKYGYVGKILGYALTLNVQTVCITDGISWHIHADLQQGKTEPIVIALTENSLLAAANSLIHWLDAAQSGHGIKLVSAGASPALASIPVEKPTKRAKSVAKPQSLSAVPSSKFTELAQLHLLSLQPGQKPKQLRLPNGIIKPISTWKDILVEMCRLVLATNAQLQLPLPDKAGKKCFLFALDKPLVGSSTPASYKNKTVFIYTNYNAANCIANALHAVQQLPANQRLATLAVSF